MKITPGRIIREARDAAEMSQVELSILSGVEQSLLSKIENDKQPISLESYIALTAALPDLKRIDLLNAMGWTVTATGAERIPPELVTIINQLEPKYLAALHTDALALLALQRSQERPS